jgi:hypothetical protein
MTVRSGQCTLRQWGVYQKTLDAVKSKTCGELCSLRWTWLSRSDDASHLGVLAELLEVSRELAGRNLQRLHVEAVNDSPACFALAQFGNDIVAEFEINEAPPSSVPEARFLVADFTGGRVTNRPLVGFHHSDGAFLATNAGAEAILFEPVPVVSVQPQDAEIQKAITLALKGAA